MGNDLEFALGAGEGGRHNPAFDLFGYGGVVPAAFVPDAAGGGIVGTVIAFNGPEVYLTRFFSGPEVPRRPSKNPPRKIEWAATDWCRFSLQTAQDRYIVLAS